MRNQTKRWPLRVVAKLIIEQQDILAMGITRKMTHHAPMQRELQNAQSIHLAPFVRLIIL
ncbi:Putative uncharacterized protein [Halomonas sp. R57-5]|nr:Putative uncharacterized protein [Halomonas sp. R57-5]